MFRFEKRYFALAVLIFFIEVVIALYVHDTIIRPYVGDFLVVIFLYCLVRAFLNVSIFAAGISVFIFACIIETLQYFRLVELLHLQHSQLARIVIGTTFQWFDFVTYFLGIGFVFLVERMRKGSIVVQ